VRLNHPRRLAAKGASIVRLEPIIERALIRPQTVSDLDIAQWDRLIQSGRRLGLLARIQVLLAEQDLLDAIPAQPRMHLDSARIVADNEQRIMQWEINRIRRVLSPLEKPVVFLKGAAYLIAGLPVARGRISTDIDILVDKPDLPTVEAALLQHGWDHVKVDDYDQYYYRVWSHELPPLRHRERHTTIDVHHTILPLTGRCHPDPKKLLANAISLDGSQFKILAPIDMVLHSAAHAFQDGDLMHGLRDLVDLDALLRQFGTEANFWDRLFARSHELDLTRSFYYALHYTSSILHTPVPQMVLTEADKFAPSTPTRLLMDRLVIHAVNDRLSGWRRMLQNLSAWVLYLRQHWLRMPPLLLARHLLHQFCRAQKLRTDLG
jgi:hypothetical protein